MPLLTGKWAHTQTRMCVYRMNRNVHHAATQSVGTIVVFKPWLLTIVQLFMISYTNHCSLFLSPLGAPREKNIIKHRYQHINDDYIYVHILYSVHMYQCIGHQVFSCPWRFPQVQLVAGAGPEMLIRGRFSSRGSQQVIHGHPVDHAPNLSSHHQVALLVRHSALEEPSH